MGRSLVEETWINDKHLILQENSRGKRPLEKLQNSIGGLCKSLAYVDENSGAWGQLCLDVWPKRSLTKIHCQNTKKCIALGYKIENAIIQKISKW